MSVTSGYMPYGNSVLASDGTLVPKLVKPVVNGIEGRVPTQVVRTDDLKHTRTIGYQKDFFLS